MKKIFRKAMTVLGSAALVGATMGTAVAASGLDDFQSNSAIVISSSASMAQSDGEAAIDIQSALNSMTADGGVTLTGGESFMLEKSSNKFNVGDNLSTIYSTLDEDEMDFLAEGTYRDGKVKEDYDQEIALSDNTLGLFADKDYEDDEPTVGFFWKKKEHILNYTIEFDDPIDGADMEETDMPFLGSDYYVLEVGVDNDTITLLDSAESTIISEDETITVGGKEISVSFLSDRGAKLSVDGELTDQLDVGDDPHELEDGSYIAVTELLTTPRETTTQKVEIAIGSGKIILEDGKEVIIGDDSDDEIDELYAYIDDSASEGVTSVTLQWNSDDETFLTEDNPITMPGFGVIGLTYEGLNTPDSEIITVEDGDVLTILMDNYDFPLAEYYNSGVYAGEEDYPLILANATDVNTTNGWADNYSAEYGLNLQEGDRFIVTNIGDDLSEVETLYYEVTTVENDSEDIDVVLEDLIGNDDITFDEIESNDVGDVTVALKAVNGTDTDARAYISFTGTKDIYFDRLVSDKGLIIELPSVDEIEAINDTTDATLTFIEADEDEDLGQGTSFTTTISLSSNDKLHISDVDETNLNLEETSNDKYTGLVNSELASVITTDESGDEYEFSIEYFGEERSAEVSVVVGGSEEASSEAGVEVYTDAESADFAGMDLIVVGGSAINSVAADLLGGDFREAAFTAETGVAPGEYLIQTFEMEDGDNIATVVAGYNAEDTEMGVTYFLNQDVDTTEGTKYVGTSAEEATQVTV